MTTLHPLAWAGWATGVMVALTLTRNPWLLALILIIIALITVQQQRLSVRANNDTSSPAHPLTLSPLRFGLIVVTTSALFNVLMVHVGGHVLATLPPALPLIGGPLTLEALVYGALNGLVLAGLFAAFNVLNRVLPVRSMLRLVPRAYYPAAVVMSIAVTFAPSALQQVQQVREAQAVRGLQLKGVRSWLPLLVPLLEGSLERSMQLAEAMMARGFAAAEPAPDRRPQLLILLGMAAWLSGWLLRLAWQQEAAGWTLLGGGVVLVLIGLWSAGRAHPHTTYRPDLWHARDFLVLAAAAVTALAYLLPWPSLDRAPLFYYPYAGLTWPAVSWPLLAATLGLAGPLAVRG